MRAQIVDTTNGSEDGRLILSTVVAGSNVDTLFASGGKVGIGTNSMLGKLDVSGNNGSGGYVGVIRNDTNTAAYHGLLVSTVFDTTATNILHLKTNAADPVAGGTDILRVTGDGRAISNFTGQFWVNYKGTDTAAIRDSHNVSSVTDRGTGQYTVVINVDMNNTLYCPLLGNTDYLIGNGDTRWSQRITDIATTGVNVVMCKTAVNGFAYQDADHILLAGFGDAAS